MYGANKSDTDANQLQILINPRASMRKRQTMIIIEYTDFVFKWLPVTPSLDWFRRVVTTKHLCETFYIRPQERGHKRQNKKSQQRLSLGKDHAKHTYCRSGETHKRCHAACIKLGGKWVSISYCLKTRFESKYQCVCVRQFHENFGLL